MPLVLAWITNGLTKGFAGAWNLGGSKASCCSRGFPGGSKTNGLESGCLEGLSSDLDLRLRELESSGDRRLDLEPSSGDLRVLLESSLDFRSGDLRLLLASSGDLREDLNCSGDLREDLNCSGDLRLFLDSSGDLRLDLDSSDLTLDSSRPLVIVSGFFWL